MRNPARNLTAALFTAFTLTGLALGADRRPVLKSLDPVLLTEGKEAPGKAEYSVSRGQFLYLFSGAETKTRFERDPERYGIQLEGECVLGPEMDGNPDQFAVVQGRIYLGTSPWCLTTFKKEPGRFVDVSTGKRVGTIYGANRKKAGILVFPEVEIIDSMGPYEVLGAGGFETFLIGETKEPVKTAMGMTLVPRYSFADCPKLDVLVVPGGGGSRPGTLGVGGQMDNVAFLGFLKARSTEAEIVLSVCNGAFLLARAGLLDGLTATTFNGGIDDLAQDYPKVTVVRDRRFVDNGKVVTTAGLSSGIDGALHLVERLRGKGQAQRTALGLEYDWRPDSGFARAALADIVMRPAIGQGFDIPEGATWIVESDAGDRKSWEKVYTVAYKEATAEGILGVVDKKLELTWKKLSTDRQAEGLRTRWSFSDPKGARWEAVTQVTSKDASKGLFTLLIRVAQKA